MIPIIDIVFHGDPGTDRCMFAEVERDGKGINFGEWIDRKDGFWALRIPDHEAIKEEVIRLAKEAIAGQEANLEYVQDIDRQTSKIGGEKSAANAERWALNILRAQLTRVLAPLGFDPLK